MQRCYPLGCMEGRKQSIRRKALNKFVLKDGKLYLKKKKKKKQKGKVSCLECSLFHPIHRNVSVLVSRVARFYSLIKAPYMPAVPAFSPFVHVNKTTECLLSQLHSLLQVVEVRYISNSDEQRRIFSACHVDPTAGHMGAKWTLSWISERFKWSGMVKDVHDLVRAIRISIVNMCVSWVGRQRRNTYLDKPCLCLGC